MNEFQMQIIELIIECVTTAGFASLAFHVITKQMPAREKQQDERYEKIAKALNDLENNIIRVYERVKNDDERRNAGSDPGSE